MTVVGAQLKFSCTDMDLTATSAAGDLCTGDYLRYDQNTLIMLPLVH